MKVLFSADWHLKVGQKNVPKEWQINRYRALFEKIHTLTEEVDLHIIGGDIFDKIPKPEEVFLFFEFIKGINVETIIYDGNHEATKKGKTFLEHFANATNNINNLATIIFTSTSKYGIDFIPYTELKTFKSENFNNDILCTHVRGEIPPHVHPEIDLSKLDRWKVVLAGDLHSYENSQRNILYPGSPLSISFHRKPIKNGIIIFDTETFEHKWIDLHLPQLIRKTVESAIDIVETEYDHTIYEITGNIADLSGIDTTSKLIDKKIVHKTSESTLNLTNKSTQEELKIYLEKIAKLEDNDIAKCMGVFNDYYSRISLG